VRVLPVIFSFEPPKGIALYPGQLVDIFIEDKEGARVAGASH
jgi:HlyD family secretion protein